MKILRNHVSRFTFHLRHGCNSDASAGDSHLLQPRHVHLDTETGAEILKLLSSLNRDENLTIIMVTHDPSVAQRADRVVRLAEGKAEELDESAVA